MKEMALKPSSSNAAVDLYMALPLLATRVLDTRVYSVQRRACSVDTIVHGKSSPVEVLTLALIMQPWELTHPEAVKVRRRRRHPLWSHEELLRERAGTVNAGGF